MKLISSIALLGILSSAQAAKIAVIDSGLDYKHEMIVPNLWTNPNEVLDRRDNDGNGYQDDIHGWNFAEKNPLIIDYKYLGTFSEDCKKFFDIQGKVFLSRASESEIQWMRQKQTDTKFLAEMSKFGNFVHGTHVAGIAIRQSNSEVMGLKLLPTEIRPFITGLKSASDSKVDRWKLLASGFSTLAREQMKLLTEIAYYIHGHQVDVANGSFGTGFRQAKMISDIAFRALFLRKPTEEESNRVAGLFISALVNEGKRFVAAAPKTLFVFAAGNDGMSNDLYGTSPANIKADNVITVGATFENEFFAPFSNFGTKMVEIAAPGMLIDSAIPGNDYLRVSGTSQAAPLVANIAARVKELNPQLSPAQVKEILMGTVDKKPFLADKVATSGIINPDRALMAAELSTKSTLSQAISRSRTMVRDVAPVKSRLAKPAAIVPIPLSPMFN
jgi:cell wall-associated protease